MMHRLAAQHRRSQVEPRSVALLPGSSGPAIVLCLLLTLAPGLGARVSAEGSGDGKVYLIKPSVRPCLNLRRYPNTGAPILDCLQGGTPVTVVHSITGWVKGVTREGTEGWLAADYLQPSGISAAAQDPEEEDSEEAPPTIVARRVAPSPGAGEAAELEELLDQLADVTRERDILAAHLRRVEGELKAARKPERESAPASGGPRSRPDELWETRPREGQPKEGQPKEGQLKDASLNESLAIPPEPLAAAPAAQAATPGPEGAVEALFAWAEAGSRQRVDDHFSFYAEDFRPADGRSRDRWREERRRRLEASPQVGLSVSAVETLPLGPRKVSIRFRQRYRSPGYEEVVVKVVVMDWRDGAWKIVEERIEGADGTP